MLGTPEPFFDVEGAVLDPRGAEMFEKPTLLLLHGGPGMDLSPFRPAFAALAETAQVIYLDHRGQGRSDRGTPADWTLERLRAPSATISSPVAGFVRCTQSCPIEVGDVSLSTKSSTTPLPTVDGHGFSLWANAAAVVLDIMRTRST